MKTDELIRSLRSMAEFARLAPINEKLVLVEAADRLEELEERVAIMGENGEQVTMTDILRGGA